MCARCQAEYEDPLNRRFHAEPNACPDCGPSLALLSAEELSSGGAAAFASGHESAAILDRARVAASRGARSSRSRASADFIWSATRRTNAPSSLLRERKRRSGKAFAIMVRTIGSRRTDLRGDRRGSRPARGNRAGRSFCCRGATDSAASPPASHPETRAWASCCLTRRCIICCSTSRSTLWS